MAIGLVAGGRPEVGFFVFGIGGDAERQAGGQQNFLTIAIGWQMAGVGEGHGAIRVNASRQTGDEAAAQIAGQGVIEFAKDLDRSVVGKHAQ